MNPQVLRLILSSHNEDPLPNLPSRTDFRLILPLYLILASGANEYLDKKGAMVK